MAHTAIDLKAILATSADRPATRMIVIEQRLLERAGALLKDVLPGGEWLLLADENTFRAAGARVRGGFEDASLDFRQLVLETPAGRESVVADESTVDRLAERLRARSVKAVVAVGSGTINDIAKLAAFRAGLPYAVVATAPSMNGYTSSMAAILSDGVKTTPRCHPPVACLADLDVLAQAPYRMIAAGLGDLASKPVSNADWRLSRRLLGTDYSPEAVAMAEEAARMMEGVAARLPGRDVEAVGRLTAALCLSGFAMSLAGSSSPASGGEHLISHYLDMRHFAFGEPRDLHGCQVGVGTLAAAALYEKLVEMNGETVDPDARLSAYVDWADYEELLRERFGPVSDAVIEHARQGYPAREELRARLHALKADWPAVVAEVREGVPRPEAVRAELEAARCPTTFAEIGVGAERARAAILHSKDIRPRYTILHLAWELGMLESWADAALARTGVFNGKEGRNGA